MQYTASAGRPLVAPLLWQSSIFTSLDAYVVCQGVLGV